jgi:TatD DNase family protein
MFIDVHCHLERFSEKEIELILEECKNKNVRLIITDGIDIKTNRTTLSLAEKFPQIEKSLQLVGLLDVHGAKRCGIKAALGIYPIDALSLSEKQLNEEIKFIENNKSKIISVGEVGLDLQESDNLEKQKEILIKFIKLSNKLNKPLTIHSRKAERECLALLEEHKAKKVLMHHFAGRLTMVNQIVDNGWFLSIPSSIEYSEHFQQMVKRAPLSSLLCETDSPFLHPERKRNNSPANVLYAYRKIAEIKGLSLQEVEMQIENNFNRLFS